MGFQDSESSQKDNMKNPYNDLILNLVIFVIGYKEQYG